MSGRPRPVGARGLRAGDWLLGLLPAAVLLVIWLSVSLVDRPELAAQVAPAKDAANPSVEHGFSLVFDDRLSESLAKFEGYVKARTWEKAFRILADVPEDKWSSMLPDREGFIRPASLRVRETLLELPADGREAYRIYFDAKARRLLESIGTAQKEDDVKIARTIYDRYFLTSVGDDAADRLAEDFFERGQFAEAARCWKSIFEYHPDTNLPEATILVKRAIALFRGGTEGEYRGVRQQLQQQFPGARVVLGGREVVADEYLKGLESEQARKGAGPKGRKMLGGESRETVFRGLAPADGTEPAWQFRFLEEKELATIEESVRNWYGAITFSAILPAAVTDGQRIYGNWLGFCFAIDVATGKMAWSTQPNVKDLVSRLRGNYARLMSYTTSPGQFAICLGRVGEGMSVVLTVSASPNQANRFRLVAHEASTGGELWSSERAASGLSKESFIGTPLVDGNSIYALSQGASPENQQAGPFGGNSPSAKAIVLHRLDLRTGTEIWSLSLGTPQLVGTGYGQQFVPIPALVLSGGRLYVLTNDGALLAVDVDRRQIDWAFKYPVPSYGQNRQPFFNPVVTPGRQERTTGPIVVRDGVIYFKESMGTTLYAVDENGPRLRWKLEDSELTSLVGLDDSDLYLFYGELSAISRTKPLTRWSNRLTVELPGVGAQVGSRAVLVFTPRGLFELSKETGDVSRIFRGADLGSAGGYMLLAGNRLVCVSNLAVTAYPDSSTN